MIEFNLSLFGIIGIGLATMFFGYFFGLFEGRGQGYKRRRKEEALEEQADVALRKAPVPASTPAPGRSASSSPRLLELSSDQNGRPHMLLDGQGVERDSVSASQRKRLIELMVMMRPWIEGAVSTNEPPPGPRQAAPPSTAAPLPSRKSAESSRPASAAPTSAETSAAPAEPTPAMSMVAQIDAILQGRLAGTALADRGVRLTESLNGGVNVFVGLTRFESIADVEDPEIQAAIRSAIAEWEQKYTPS
jgi:hypothetical protein